MPLAVSDVFDANFTFVDNNGNAGGTGLYLPRTLFADIGDYEGYVAQLAAAMTPLSNAGLRTASLRLDQYDNAIDPNALDPSSEVERKLLFIFNTTNRYSKRRIEVPSPIFSLETDGTDNVDPANALVATFIAAVVNGPAGLGNGATSPAGFSATSVESVRIIHRSRGTGRRR